MKSYDDPQIWTLIREGRRDALAMLFNKYYLPLLNYGLKLHTQKALIKDCIQDIFMQLWISREKISLVENIRSYLYTALRRKIIELDRSDKARVQRQKDYSDQSSTEFLNTEEWIILNEDKSTKEEKLRQAIDQLSKRQKEAVYLKFFDGFTNEEIAVIMSVNKQSVYNLISEALKRMQDYLEQF